MKNNELISKLRKGITVVELVKKLKDFEQAFIIIKDVNGNELDNYWYRRYCPHEERQSDNYKVLTVSITKEVSIIRFTQDPQIVLTVNNLEVK